MIEVKTKQNEDVCIFDGIYRTINRATDIVGLYSLSNGPVARYIKLRVAHAPGMTGTFSPLPWVSDPDMHRGTCVTHVPWCMPGSLTSGFLWRQWRGKRSWYSCRMCNPTFYVSDKRPISCEIGYHHYYSEIWKGLRQRCCPNASQISERSDDPKLISFGFEISRHLMLKSLTDLCVEIQGP